MAPIAPRPVTPQPDAQPTGRPRFNSWSAPNSPARSVGGGSPGINRLPSQDSLDRSIHNDSGNGKSTAQVIKELKRANAALTDKTAKMEVSFMNQLADATRPFEEKQQKMEEGIKQMKKQLAQLEAYKVAADSKLKEKEGQLAKTKEESAFQRHTISDLKSQLHHLQTELDDAEQMNNEEEMEQLIAENKELVATLEEAKQQNSRIQELEQELEDLKQEKATSTPTDGVTRVEVEGLNYYKQWQQTRGELESQSQRLNATKLDLENLQLEQKNLKEEQSKRVQELETELQSKTERFSEREQDLQDQIASMDFDAVEELQSQIMERDEAIADLNEQLQEYAEKAAELAAALDQVQEASANQEQYRRDEAEDLRILHDAQEEAITKLRKDLDDTQRELELKDEELNETNKSLEKSSNEKKEEITRLKRELDDSQRAFHDAQMQRPPLPSTKTSEDDEDLIFELEDQLNLSREKVTRLQEEIADLIAENEELAALSTQHGGKEELRKQLDEAQIALAALEDEKEDLIQKHGEILSQVEKEKEAIEMDSRLKLAAKNDELYEAAERLAILDDLEAERDALQQRIKSLEPNLESREGPFDKEPSELSEENESLKAKLKDRDTTIAALVRSTMTVEDKVAGLENELHELTSARDEDRFNAEGEIEELKRTIESYQVEEKAREEDIIELEKQLQAANNDIKIWRQAVQSDGSSKSEYRYQIAILQKNVATSKLQLQDRDDEIEDLIAQSDAAETHIKELETRISALMKENENLRKTGDTELRRENHRLQSENDLFAGQVVEQDEEIKTLVRELQLRNQTIFDLERDLEAGGVDGRSRDEAAADEMEILALQDELAQIQSDLQIRNQMLMQYRQELDELRRQPSNEDDAMLRDELEELQEVNDEYRLELRNLRSDLWEAKQAAAAANDLKLELAQAKYALDEFKRVGQVAKNSGSENDSVVVELRKEVQSLQAKLDSTEGKDAGVIDDLKRQLEQAKAMTSEDMLSMAKKLEELTNENFGLGQQFETELEGKNQQIYTLEKTIHSQKQLVHNLRKQMDQFQEGMKQASDIRRGESEDLQQEFIQMQYKTKTQEREIMNLKMHMEENSREYKEQVRKLKGMLNQESTISRTMADLEQDDRMLEVRERLEKLKTQNTSLQEENIKLGGRLERASIEISSFASEREHVGKVEQENQSLRRQLKELERVLEQSKTSKKKLPPARALSPMRFRAPSPSRTAVDKENPSLKPKKLTRSGSFSGMFKKKKNLSSF